MLRSAFPAGDGPADIGGFNVATFPTTAKQTARSAIAAIGDEHSILEDNRASARDVYEVAPGVNFRRLAADDGQTGSRVGSRRFAVQSQRVNEVDRVVEDIVIAV